MWSALRWLVVLAACGVVVVLAVPAALDALGSSIRINEGDSEGDAAEPESDPPADTPAPERPTGPVTDGRAVATADFAVSEGVVRDSDSPRLSATGRSGEGIVVAFELIDGDPACVESLELAADLVEATPTDIPVYASAVTDPAQLADGDDVGELTLDDEVRARAITDGTPGRLAWDLTGLYAAWTDGLTPPGTPLVLVLRPQTEDARIVVGSVDADDSAGPRLSWTGQEGCP